MESPRSRPARLLRVVGPPESMVAARFTKSQEKVKEQTGFLRARTRRQGYPRLRAHGADGSSRLEAAIRLRAVAGSRAAAKSAISNSNSRKPTMSRDAWRLAVLGFRSSDLHPGVERSKSEDLTSGRRHWDLTSWIKG